MNLLGLLLSAMTTQSSLGQISGKTGLSEKQVKKLLMIAVPILIKYLTRNASSGSGAQSLLGALAQHKNRKEMDLQLKEADEKDGGKIINHILGNNKTEVTQNLSAQSGLTQEQVNQILAIMAPAILSGVSQATNDAAVSPQSAAPTISLGSTPGIFSALLGSAAASSKEEEQNEAINGTALLQALLNARR